MSSARHCALRTVVFSSSLVAVFFSYQLSCINVRDIKDDSGLLGKSNSKLEIFQSKFSSPIVCAHSRTLASTPKVATLDSPFLTFFSPGWSHKNTMRCLKKYHLHYQYFRGVFVTCLLAGSFFLFDRTVRFLTKSPFSGMKNFLIIYLVSAVFVPNSFVCLQQFL